MKWFRSKPHSHILRSPTKDGSTASCQHNQINYSTKIFERFPNLKKQELWGGEFWSAGKYIGTVGEATSEKTIRNYIRNQSTDKKKTETRMKQLKLFSF
jgi:REP element-mobilizing transposase RayT